LLDSEWADATVEMSLRAQVASILEKAGSGSGSWSVLPSWFRRRVDSSGTIGSAAQAMFRAPHRQARRRPSLVLG
jgi:hypothetical protein